MDPAPATHPGLFGQTHPGYVGRLAPSPTGALHVGNARSFLLAWLRARAVGGRILLRIEDLDHPKVKPETVHATLDDLRWLGLDWDGAAGDGVHAVAFHDHPGHAATVHDERPAGDALAREVNARSYDPATRTFRQSLRLPLYKEAFELLRQEGKVYPCACSRADIEAAQSAPHAGEDPVYPNACRGRFPTEEDAAREAGRVPAWRFHAPNGESRFEDAFCGVQVEDLQRISGDFVIARGADQPGYQLAVVVDDAAMGVTEVVRADDLLPSTHRQLALYDALGLQPPAFLHVPLVVGADGRRLAKRHGDTRLHTIREAGISPERVLGWIAKSCGWTDRLVPMSMGEVAERFSLETIPRHPVMLDAEAYAWLGVPAP